MVLPPCYHCYLPAPNPQPYTLQDTPYNIHPTPYTLHLAPYTLHPTLHTLHHTTNTLHPTPYTLHHEPQTLHQVSFAPEEFLFRTAEACKEMYFVVSGLPAHPGVD